MSTLDTIPFAVDRAAFDRAIRLESYPELSDDVDRFVAHALETVRPKATFVVAYVDERDQNRVVIDGHEFESEVFSRNLSEINRVFAYVATCGTEIDAIDLAQFDPFASFWHDVFKTEALGAAVDFLYDHIRTTFDIEQLSSMNPGSGSVDIWPIQQQRELFDLIGDVHARVGVTLTDSYLMVPDKTLSGVLFASDVLYVNCHTCDRKACPNRRAPYKGPIGVRAGS